MEDPVKRIKNLQNKVTELKARKISAEKTKKEIEDELKEKGIKVEDLEKLIENSQSEKEKLEKELEKLLKEAEDVITRNQI